MSESDPFTTTVEALQRTVDAWLPRLGLLAWRVTVVESPKMDHSDAILEVNDHENAHRAIVYAAPWLIHGGDMGDAATAEVIDAAYVEQAVVHELCHLIFRDVREMVQQATVDELAGPVKSVLHTALSQMEEAAVDDLAGGLTRHWPDPTGLSGDAGE